MTTELINPATGEILPGQALALQEAPTATLSAARDAARALQDVVAKKKNPVLFKGEQYLEYEDWQCVGRFYSVTAKVVSVEPIVLGETRGFHAVAVALHQGQEISRAEAYCMGDEANWKEKPLFQLASMAQTRACAKSLRNVLAWVVVLAGYRPTPAEELDAQITKSKTPVVRDARTDDDDKVGSQLISDKQAKRLYAISKEKGWPQDALQSLLGTHGYVRSTEITKADYETITTELQAGPPTATSVPAPAAKVPF